MTLDELCTFTIDELCGLSPDDIARSAGGNYYPPNTDGNGTPTPAAVSTAARFGANNATAGTMPPPPSATEIADAVLSRSAAEVEAAADPHSLCYVILAMSHADTTTHPGKLTVFKTTGDEYTRKTISAQAGADPMTGIQ